MGYKKSFLERLKVNYAPDYLERIGVDVGQAMKGKAQCPVCKARGHINQTPSFSFNSVTGKCACFCGSGCIKGVDIIEIQEKINNVDFKQAVLDISGIVGVMAEYEDWPKGRKNNPPASKASGAGTMAQEREQAPAPEDKEREPGGTRSALPIIDPPAPPEPDTAQDTAQESKQGEREKTYAFLGGLTVSQAKEQYKDQKDYWYLRARGIRESTQDKYGVMALGHKCLIPVGEEGIFARDMREDSDIPQGENSKQNAGKFSLFWPQALDDEIVFVTESAIDSMSIDEAGGSACALCGVANYEYLKNALQARKDKKLPWPKCFIIALDNDEPGREGIDKLKNVITEFGSEYFLLEYPGPGMANEDGKPIKDCNEWFVAERQDFINSIARQKEMAYIQKVLPNKKELVSASGLIPFFKHPEYRGRMNIEYKTGFESLDDILNGGLQQGLYCIGAVSALGKTGLCLQIADNVAKLGNDVLYLSLEMEPTELAAKSLSRISYELAGGTNSVKGESFGAHVFFNNRNFEGLTDPWKYRYMEAVAKYGNEIASKVHFSYGHMTIDNIRDKVQEYVGDTGKKPLVVLDYLQLIRPRPTDYKMTNKQIMDIAMDELNDMVNKYEIPILAISAINRNSYEKEMTLSSLKESGGIEYGADVIIGIEYNLAKDEEKRGVDKKIIEDCKKDCIPFEVNFKILKNRYGPTDTLILQSVPARSWYGEVTGNGDKKSGRPF